MQTKRADAKTWPTRYATRPPDSGAPVRPAFRAGHAGIALLAIGFAAVARMISSLGAAELWSAAAMLPLFITEPRSV